MRCSARLVLVPEAHLLAREPGDRRLHHAVLRRRHPGEGQRPTAATEPRLTHGDRSGDVIGRILHVCQVSRFVAVANQQRKPAEFEPRALSVV